MKKFVHGGLFAGIALVAVGLCGLFGPRLTGNDGAILMAGAILFGGSLIASKVSPGNV